MCIHGQFLQRKKIAGTKLKSELAPLQGNINLLCSVLDTRSKLDITTISKLTQSVQNSIKSFQNKAKKVLQIQEIEKIRQTEQVSKKKGK